MVTHAVAERQEMWLLSRSIALKKKKLGILGVTVIGLHA